jgi:rhamnogalacturonan endolyase
MHVLVAAATVLLLFANEVRAARVMENVDRGLVAVKVSGGVYVGWRMLGTEPATVTYNVYRGATKVNSSPIASSTNYLDAAGTLSSAYSVAAIIDGVEQSTSTAVTVWANSYLSIPTTPPANGTEPDGRAYWYSVADCSVGDLDGDGHYELVLKWDPNDGQDNSIKGYTGNVYLEGIKLDGTSLWRIDLGRNIRAGAHYTQFMVYDLNGDGKAEVVCKTAPGTKDGLGNNVIMGTDNPNADYRNSNGYIISGPEYLTVFSGPTGANLATTAYDPPRGNVSDWGDSYGNRVDRFLACVAYLDGVRPSVVMCRGYYTRSVLVAYNWRDGQLTKLWRFDTNDDGKGSYADQGNHNLGVGDVDGDGKDEIVYGACCIDDDGSGLYTTGLGHGDAMQLTDMDPNRPGLEVWSSHENSPNVAGAEYRNAGTGALIFGNPSTSDVGRAVSADLDPRFPGYEMYTVGGGTSGLYNVNGTRISNTVPSTSNMAIWWDADLQRELLDYATIYKWNYANSTNSTLLNAGVSPYNCWTAYNNNKPLLIADLFGDWKEEVILRTTDNLSLKVFVNPVVSTNRIYCLMQNPQYRLAVAWQNVAYNQYPCPDFYLGGEMATPAAPNIAYVGTDMGALSPNPTTWYKVPAAKGTTAVTMTATLACGRNETEYYFTCVSGNGHDSGWQWNSTYVDRSLLPATTYTYTAKTREKGNPLTETTAAAALAATTNAIGSRPDGPLVDDYATAAMWHMEPLSGSSTATTTPDDVTITSRIANDMQVGKGYVPVTLAAGQSGFGQALDFGTDGRQMAQGSSSFPTSQEMRVEFWMKIPSMSMLPLSTAAGGTGAATMYITSISDASSNNEVLGLGIDTTGTLLAKFTYIDGSYLRPTIPMYVAGSIDRTGKWLHVVAYNQYNAIPVPGEPDHNRVVLSVSDGTTTTVSTLTGAKALRTSSSKTIYVGQMAGKTSITPYRGFRGLMDEMKISTVANYPGYVCSARPVADITVDCRVDFADLAVLAAEYAAGTPSLANFDGDGNVDLADLAIMANEWLSCGRTPQGQCE